MAKKNQRTVILATLLTVSLCAGCCGIKKLPAPANSTENQNAKGVEK